MKATMLRALAGAAVVATLGGAASAATYTVTYFPTIFSNNVPTFTAMAEVDFATHTLSKFDVLGYDEVVSDVYWNGNIVNIVGKFLGDAGLTMNLLEGTFTLLGETYQGVGYFKAIETPAPVPLPAALPLLAAALATAGVVSRRRKPA